MTSAPDAFRYAANIKNRYTLLAQVPAVDAPIAEQGQGDTAERVPAVSKQARNVGTKQGVQYRQDGDNRKNDSEHPACGFQDNQGKDDAEPENLVGDNPVLHVLRVRFEIQDDPGADAHDKCDHNPVKDVAARMVHLAPLRMLAVQGKIEIDQHEADHDVPSVELDARQGENREVADMQRDGQK